MTPRFPRPAPILTASLALLCPALAHAHAGLGAGFAAGFAHPWNGPDHVSAMLAIGLWAGQHAGRARLAIPASFVGALAVGAALGSAGVPLPHVEAGIAASLLAFGALVACAARLPLPASALVAGGFALLHGHAHGSELVAAAALAPSLGLLTGTALLHALGLFASLAAQRTPARLAIRATGAAIAACGLYLVWGSAA